MRAHRLKIWPEAFAAARTGDKTHELRRYDRDFQKGDFLLLQEFDPKVGALTGDTLGRVITFMSKTDDNPYGLKVGFIILSVIKAQPEHTAMMRNNAGAIEWIEPK